VRFLYLIQIQKLFIVALVLKLVFLFIGWSLGSSIFWSSIAPLAVMLIYIAIGLKRQTSEVSDDKFADSCYYLGFIFTIGSIIFCLFDLPNIGMKINDMAYRFGAAMISTVLGLGVRVYLVTFKQDASEAIEDAEASVVEAAHRFREQMVMGLEKMGDFQSKVEHSSQQAIERINLALETQAKNHSDRLIGFFDELSRKNELAVTTSLNVIQEASTKLSDSVNEYSSSLTTNLDRLEKKVDDFSIAITDRLKSTTFPDDFFSTNLAKPLSILSDSTIELGTQIKKSIQQVEKATNGLTDTLQSVKDKSETITVSMKSVDDLISNQRSQIQTIESQSSFLNQLNTSLSALDLSLNQFVNNVASGELSRAVSTSLTGNLKAEVELSINSVSEQATQISEKLNAIQASVDDMKNSNSALPLS